MTHDEIIKLIKQGEGIRIEFKSAENLVPSWHKNGTQLLKNTWPDNQPFIKKKMLTVPSSNSNGTQLSQKGTKLRKKMDADNLTVIKELIKKVPGWSEKGTKLFQKKSWYLLSVLFLSSEPIKLSDLLNALNYKNEKSFRDKYIRPLRQVDFIRFTNPETPTDPENKYMLTEKGKSFLGVLI